MTKKEHEALQKLVNTQTAYKDKADRAFKRLQSLNEIEGTGHRWCSAEQNMKDLLSVGKDYVYVYNNYVEFSAKADAIGWELGGELAELNFWK